jgi:tRNA (mo5U34)-methyltransferase
VTQSSAAEVARIRSVLADEGPPAWFHNFEVIKGSGIYTDPGKQVFDVTPALHEMQISDDWWAGKRVLDIGAFSGAFSFYLEDCGADVTAIDIQSPATNGFAAVAKARRSRVQHHMLSVYDLCPERFGEFDAVLFFGVFYHLKHPLLALERINSVCRLNGLLIGGGTVADRWFHDDNPACDQGANFRAITRDSVTEPTALTVASLNSLAISGFSPDHFLGDNSNWFIPNSVCLEAWLRSSGFNLSHSVVADLETNWVRPNLYRAGITFRASKVGDAISEYKFDTYGFVRKNMDHASMYEFRIPTQFEVDRLRRELDELKGLRQPGNATWQGLGS